MNEEINVMREFALIVFIIAVVAWGDFCRADEYAIHEQFATLDAWVPITFPKIEKHSEYEVVQEGNDSQKQEAQSLIDSID